MPSYHHKNAKNTSSKVRLLLRSFLINEGCDLPHACDRRIQIHSRAEASATLIAKTVETAYHVIAYAVSLDVVCGAYGWILNKMGYL